MTQRRRTIGREALFGGIGVHSGERTSVKISPMENSGGICFKFGERVYPIRSAAVTDTTRCTKITFPGGEAIRTAEHLLAAVVGLRLDDVLIEPRGSEIPIMDGSAAPFAAGLKEAGIAEKDEISLAAGISSPVCIDRGDASIMALPSDELRFTYIVNYGALLGVEMKDVIMTQDSFENEIAPARTFVLASEVEALLAAGIGLGGDESCVMIMGLNGAAGGYRVESECASHKLLDLMGDLALVGGAITAHYICIRGGHWLHALLASRLRGLGKGRA
ncbi:UDP-3-O-acyl-N-acetylglucosamine deacetylase [Synergistales bacterium]|nr:UDP-3-O-acyl-N-acetylglucosamine deacetylase [Synergistales bacterium]